MIRDSVLGLNWIAIVAGTLVLWFSRLAFRTKPSIPAGTTSTIANKSSSASSIMPREGSQLALCFIVSASIAAAQSASIKSFQGAVGLGILLSLVPVTFFLGVGEGAQQPEKAMRSAARSVIGIVGSSLAVYLIQR